MSIVQAFKVFLDCPNALKCGHLLLRSKVNYSQTEGKTCLEIFGPSRTATSTVRLGRGLTPRSVDSKSEYATF